MHLQFAAGARRAVSEIYSNSAASAVKRQVLVDASTGAQTALTASRTRQTTLLHPEADRQRCLMLPCGCRLNEGKVEEKSVY